MPDATGLQRYQENSVNTIGPEKLIVMLYEGLMRYLQQARAAIVAKDMAAKAKNLNRAQAIVIELRNALDHKVGGALSANLEALYNYVFTECINALVHNRTQHIDDCLRVLAPLLDAWSRIPPGTVERARREAAGNAQTQPQVTGPVPASSPKGLSLAAEGEKNNASSSTQSTLSIAV